MPEDLSQLLKEFGVVRQGHFLLTSGMHSDRYFEKFRILERPNVCEHFARALANNFQNMGVTVVCGPTTGGVIVAYELARQMGCRCIIAERSETGRKIGRGFYIGKEDQVLVVDDVLTTGGSIRETLSALETTGARVVGIGVFIDRSSGVRFPFPFYAAHREEIQNYQPDNCPLCRAKVPLEIPGRGERP